MSIHKGDIGAVIAIDVGEDLDLADEVKVYVKKPYSASSVEWTNSVDGQEVSCTTADGDLSVAGTYRFQVWADLGSWSGYSSITTLEVEDNL